MKNKRRLNSKKAQLSYEYLVIVGSVLVLLLPFFYKFMGGVATRLNEYYAVETVNELAHTTKTVANLGPESKVTVPFRVQGITQSNILKEDITLKLSTGDISAKGARCVGASPGTLQGTGTFYTPVKAISYGDDAIGIAVGNGPVIFNIKGEEEVAPKHGDCFPDLVEIDTNEGMIVYGANFKQNSQLETEQKGSKQKGYPNVEYISDSMLIIDQPNFANKEYIVTVLNTKERSNDLNLKGVPPGQDDD